MKKVSVLHMVYAITFGVVIYLMGVGLTGDLFWRKAKNISQINLSFYDAEACAGHY